jgi:hypothetical protein
MSSGALVRATSVSVVVLCAALVVTRSRGFARHSRGVGLGVLAVDVEGVCCKPKDSHSMAFSANLIQRRARLLRVLKKMTRKHHVISIFFFR